MNKWTRRFEWNGASARAADPENASPLHHYFAFLSYSHDDAADADWLHEALEQFRVPSSLAGKLTANGVIPARLSPIFRDRHELAAGQDLTDEIRMALSASRCLIVLCSPAAARSKWTNAEIEFFKRAHPDGCIIAAIIAGEPMGPGDSECFPAALTQKYDRLGRPTGRHVEPLAADLRQKGEARRIGILKIVAGILGLGLDDLVQRDQLRRQRRLAAIAGGSLVGFIGASILAVTAIQARDEARDQRRQAESLIEYMVGDLKDRLEPIGRLDVLDGVGSRVLQYYRNQDPAQLSDQSLAQRSKALTLMGQIAQDRGNLASAAGFFREAFQGTHEAVSRSPDDPQRLFDHAQNVFYLSDIARLRGDLAGAETGVKEYERLALRMVALDPNNLKWRMEEQYAEADLGALYQQQRRFPEAADHIERALRTIQALAALSPGNPTYEQGVPDAMAWSADAQMSEGQLDQAVATRERHVALLRDLLKRYGDVAYREKLISGERGLGNLYGMRGQRSLAIQHLQAAVDQAGVLLPLEPTNTSWSEASYSARLDLAHQFLLDGQRPAAAAQIESGCEQARQLLAKNPKVPEWRAGLRECWVLKAQLALASGEKAEALGDALRAAEAGRGVKTSDPARDSFALVRVYRLSGEIRRSMGDSSGAKADWAKAFATLPKVAGERPTEMSEHAQLLERVGRQDEAEPIRKKLSAMGFHQTSITGV